MKNLDQRSKDLFALEQMKTLEQKQKKLHTKSIKKGVVDTVVSTNKKDNLKCYQKHIESPNFANSNYSL